MHFKSSGQISQALAFFKSLNGYGSLEFSTEFSSCSLHWFDLFLSEYTNLTNGPIIGEYYTRYSLLEINPSVLRRINMTYPETLNLRLNRFISRNLFLSALNSDSNEHLGTRVSAANLLQICSRLLPEVK